MNLRTSLVASMFNLPRATQQLAPSKLLVVKNGTRPAAAQRPVPAATLARAMMLQRAQIENLQFQLNEAQPSPAELRQRELKKVQAQIVRDLERARQQR